MIYSDPLSWFLTNLIKFACELEVARPLGPAYHVWGPSPISTPSGSHYFVIFVDDFSRYTWIYLFKNRFELYQIYRDFTKMIEIQLSKPIKVFMPKNINPMNLPLFYINFVLFLIPLMQALLSNMAGLSANFVIFLMLFVLLLLPLLVLLSFGGKLLLLPFTPSIDVLLPLFRIKLLMICCLVLLPHMTYLKSLNVSVLFLFMIMKEKNFNLVLVCVVFLGIELVKNVIGVMIPLANVFVFLNMWSFGNTKWFTNYLMFLFPLFPLSILSLAFFLRSFPPHFVSPFYY